MRGGDVFLTFRGRRVEPLSGPIGAALCDRYGWLGLSVESISGGLTIRAVRRCGCEIVVSVTRQDLMAEGDVAPLLDRLVVEAAAACTCDAETADFERSG